MIITQRKSTSHKRPNSHFPSHPVMKFTVFYFLFSFSPWDCLFPAYSFLVWTLCAFSVSSFHTEFGKDGGSKITTISKPVLSSFWVYPFTIKDDFVTVWPSSPDNDTCSYRPWVKVIPAQYEQRRKASLQRQDKPSERSSGSSSHWTDKS